MLEKPDLHLRRATPSDVGVIRHLVDQAYAKWIPAIGRKPLPMLADYDEAVKNHTIDLLRLEKELVGLIETIRHTDYLWIENVAVHPDQQGKGYGKKLLAHAERVAANAGLAELKLCTNAAFEANVALYQGLGYQITVRKPFMSGTSVFMRKSLAPIHR